MTTQQQPTFLENVLGWLHKGYPEGVPPTDYYPPLLALLKRSLSEDEVVQAAQSILRAATFDTPPVSEDQIREAVREVIAKDPPNPEELNQVAARLASVGWPLESH